MTEEKSKHSRINETANIKSDDTKKVAKRCLLILKMINDGKQLNCNILAEILGVSTRTVSRYIEILNAVGYKVKYNYKQKCYVIENREEVDLSYTL